MPYQFVEVGKKAVAGQTVLAYGATEAPCIP